MKQTTQPSPEGRKAESALRKAVAKVVEESRRLGFPLAVMSNDKAILIHPRPTEKR